MNLFARILSHGFGLLVVALLAIGLIYKGELFPEWDLPDFLKFGSTAQNGQAAASGTVARDAPQQQGEMADKTGHSLTQAGSDSSLPGAGHEQGAAQADVPSVAPGGMEAGAVEAAVENEANPAVPAEVPGVRVPASKGEGEPVSETDSSTVASVVLNATQDKAEELSAPATQLTESSAAVTVSVDPDISNPVATGDGNDAVKNAAPAALPATKAQDAVQEIDKAIDATVTSTANEPKPAEQEPVGKSADATSSAAGSSVVAPSMQEAESGGVDQDTGAAADTSKNVAEGESPDPGVSEAASEKEAGSSAYKMLAAAREAYWLRDYDKAEQHYLTLINLAPGNPDGYGELGNMYFSQGKWALASASYFEAGKRLADDGLINEAKQLVEVIKGLQGEQADVLEQYINAVGSDAN